MCGGGYLDGFVARLTDRHAAPLSICILMLMCVYVVIQQSKYV